MNKVKYLFISFVLCCFFIWGCSKSIPSKQVKLDLLDFSLNESNFDYFSARAKFNFNALGKKFSGISNIRAKKDSLIWISISLGIGIEFIRILVDQNSIHYNSKISKNKGSISFEELSSKYQIDANYNIVQSMFLGKLIRPYINEKIEKKDSLYSFSSKLKNMEFTSFVGVKSKVLEKILCQNKNLNTDLIIEYKNYLPTENDIFPMHISSRVSNKENKLINMQLNLFYQKITTENSSLRFPFKILEEHEK